MNTFKGLFSSPQWITLKKDGHQFLQSLSAWLESFPKKEISVLLILFGAYMTVSLAAHAWYYLHIPGQLLSLRMVGFIAGAVVFAYLTVDRFKFVRRHFYPKNNSI